MNRKEKTIDLDDFERKQQAALLFCETLYNTDKPLERPIMCVVEGCKNPFVYNSGMCTDHAF